MTTLIIICTRLDGVDVFSYLRAMEWHLVQRIDGNFGIAQAYTRRGKQRNRLLMVAKIGNLITPWLGNQITTCHCILATRLTIFCLLFHFGKLHQISYRKRCKVNTRMTSF